MRKRVIASVFAAALALAPALVWGNSDPGGETIILPERDTFPESISAASDGTLYVGSAALGGVRRIRPHSHIIETFIPPGAYRSRSIFGVLVDERSNTLWVCSNDLSSFGVKGPGEEPGSALLGFDLATGQGRIRAALPGALAICNDIAVDARNMVYVTNSAAPEILRLSPKTGALSRWASDPRFQPPFGGGLDGIAFSPDGAAFVSIFQTGELFRVKAGKGTAPSVRRLRLSRSLIQPDALRFLGDGRLIIAEGGGRLDTATISGDEVAVKTIADTFRGPTGVARVGDMIWVADGQISYLMDPAKRGKSPDLPFRIFSVRLP